MFVPAGIGIMVSVRRQLNLVRHGRAATAVVTRHEWGGRGRYGGNPQNAAYYEFAALNGTVGSGTTQPSSHPPAIGSTLCVVYDPGNPRRNVTYPPNMARIVSAGPGVSSQAMFP